MGYDPVCSLEPAACVSACRTSQQRGKLSAGPIQRRHEASKTQSHTKSRVISRLLLIHANDINADCLDEMLKRLEARGYRFRHARRWGIREERRTKSAGW
jgi:hypothetical protein